MKESEQIHSHPMYRRNLRWQLVTGTLSIVLGNGKGREEIKISVAYNLGSS